MRPIVAFGTCLYGFADCTVMWFLVWSYHDFDLAEAPFMFAGTVGKDFFQTLFQ